MLAALTHNLLHAPAPGLDLARQVDTASNRRIRRTRDMLAHQRIDRPGLGQRAHVCNIQLVVVNTDLNRNAARIILVDERIEDQFAQGLLRERKLLNPLLAILIPDLSLEILEVDQFKRLLCLLQQRAMYIIVINEIGIILTKLTDLHIRARNPFLRLLCKKQCCSIRKAL